MQDACQAIKQYHQCFSATVNLAAESAPFPVPGKTSSTTYASKVVGALGTWFQSFEQQLVQDVGQVLSDASGTFDAFQTILDIANAYNSCD